MSTPIETNTEELQEILQTVYNLPNAGGGSSEPDLVIGLTMPIHSLAATSENTTVTIESGSLLAVAEAFRAGKCPVVKVKRNYVTNGFDTSFPVVEIGEYDCEVFYYDVYIIVNVCIPPITGVKIQFSVDDADYLKVTLFAHGYTGITVI